MSDEATEKHDFARGIAIKAPPDFYIEPPQPLDEQLLRAHEAVAVFLNDTVEAWSAKGWPQHTSSIKVTTEAKMVTTGISGLKVNLELVLHSKRGEGS